MDRNQKLKGGEVDMKRSKKLILIALLGAVLLVGSIGGVAFAQTENESNNQSEVKKGALLDRVCEIYNENTDPDIDCDALKDALAQAQSEIVRVIEKRAQLT